MRKNELPSAVAEGLSIPGGDQEWVSNGGTVEASWHIAVGEAIGVPYRPSKVAHMRRMLEHLGLEWDDDRYTSEGTRSGGGGNLKREAYLDLHTAVLRLPGQTVNVVPDLVYERQDDNNDELWSAFADEIDAKVRARRGQAEFRQSLLEAYDRTCAITGSQTVEVLEAAHISPFATGGTFEVSNGLLLRADVHTLFDLGLLQIEPETRTLEVDAELSGSEYWSLQGRRLREPNAVEARPNHDALLARYSSYGVACGRGFDQETATSLSE